MQVPDNTLPSMGNQLQSSVSPATTSQEEHRIVTPIYATTKEDYAKDVEMNIAMGERARMMDQEDAPTQKMYRAIELALDRIAEERPNLMNKGWDFGINKSGGLDLKYVEEISDSDKQYLQNILDSGGIAGFAETFADDLIFIVEAERGVNGVSNNLGRFDVSRDNFSELIDLKRAFESVSNLNKNTITDMKYNSVEVFAEQISVRADPKYQLVYNRPK